MPTVVGFLQALVAVCTVAAALLRFLGWWMRDRQNAMLYHPVWVGIDQIATPDEYGMPRYERLEIKTPDGLTLRSYFIHNAGREGESPVTLIHFHGNAGNIGHRLPLALSLQSALGCNVVLAEYRGYGASDPERVTEQGLKSDAQATLDHVRALPYVDPRGIVLYGASLGGAVAIELASKADNERKVAAIVVENTFTSVSDMVDVMFGTLEEQVTLTRMRKVVLRWLMLRLIKPLILWIGWRSIDLVPHLRVPVLLLSGDKDELIPPEHMRRLYSNCKATVKRLELVPEGTHNETWREKAFLQALGRFVLEHVVPHTAGGTGTASADGFRGATKHPELRGGVGANTALQQLDMAASRGGALLRPFVGSRRADVEQGQAHTV
eukprot:Hpha_TRINITY_DN16179_c1_g2::TRINITY_DN16179_c1_g2_i1::g.7927::m.7927/K06889/K06889; uncharacterized protein